MKICYYRHSGGHWIPTPHPKDHKINFNYDPEFITVDIPDDKFSELVEKVKNEIWRLQELMLQYHFEQERLEKFNSYVNFLRTTAS